MTRPGGGCTLIYKQIAFYSSLINERRSISKALFGNAHLLDVASAVLSSARESHFYARKLASLTGLSDPVVHPCLRRLATAGTIESVPNPGRERLYKRSPHPFWELVRDLDRRHPPEAAG